LLDARFRGHDREQRRLIRVHHAAAFEVVEAIERILL
jgi:hypothetical protein